jgi:serine/threonine protein kinase
MPDLTSRTFGRYRILSKIGEGRMGEVSRAQDQRLAREVAIKVLPEDVAADADSLRSFEREAQAVASIVTDSVGGCDGNKGLYGIYTCLVAAGRGGSGD